VQKFFWEKRKKKIQQKEGRSMLRHYKGIKSRRSWRAAARKM
jgi:hypothetical protein